MSNFIYPKTFGGFKGYLWNSRAAEYLGSGSQNCLVTEDGKATKRLGYREEFSIGVDGSSATSIYLKQYDIAFFALGTKVYYRNFADGQSYDTGLTISATSRLIEWQGIVLLSNTTDGVRIITCGRLNDAAANSGDATVTIDMDMGGRLNAFNSAVAISSNTLLINGTSEPMTSLNLATGVVTLDAPLTKTYADNTVCIVAASLTSVTGIEKYSKMEIWNNRLHGMGFPLASNADSPNATVMTGQFVAGSTAATSIELLIDFTYGTGGSTKILVNGGGKVTNILSVKDFLYFFTEDMAFAVANSEVTISGAAIGDTRPVKKDELHGCLNEDCASVMGDNAVTYVTNDRRIMRIPISTESGAAVSPPDEDFDLPIRGHLVNMSRDQTGALVYHYRGGRQTIYQISISNQWFWFIYDHNLRSQGLTNIIHGAWQPPQNIAPVKSLFERNGVLYGTDVSDDTVYSIFTAFSDNLAPIETTIASGQFEIGNAMLKDAIVKGDINQPAQINLRAYVWNDTSQKRSGSAKVVDGSTYSYSVDSSVGAVPVGESGGSGESTETARWTRTFGIFPSEANMCQLVATESQDGGYMALASLALTGRSLPKTSTSSI